MFNTTIVDRRTTTQEVKNYTETNVEASGNISKVNNNSRFININKSDKSFASVFSSVPFYIEIVQINDGQIEEGLGRHNHKVDYYKTIKTKIFVEVKQVLVVGSDYTLEVVELNREDISEPYSWTREKSKYYDLPTIL